MGEVFRWYRLGKDGQEFLWGCVEFKMSTRHPMQISIRQFAVQVRSLSEKLGWRYKFGSHQHIDDT